MKYTTKQLNIYYAQVFLDAIDASEGQEEKSFLEIYWRFWGEYNHEIVRIGQYRAYASWLQGLAINIPYMNWDILTMAEKTGYLTEGSTEHARQKVLDNYWDFISGKFFWLMDRPQAWFDKNLPEKGV